MQMLKTYVNKIQGAKDLAGIGMALFVMIFLLVAHAYYANLKREYDIRYIALTEELRILSQSIAKNAIDASIGFTNGQKNLVKIKNEINHNLATLKNGGDNKNTADDFYLSNITDKMENIPATPAYIRDNQLAATQKVWNKILNNVDIIIEDFEILNKILAASKRVNHVIPELDDDFMSLGNSNEINTVRLYLNKMLTNLREIFHGKLAYAYSMDRVTSQNKIQTAIDEMKKTNNIIKVWINNVLIKANDNVTKTDIQYKHNKITDDLEFITANWGVAVEAYAASNNIYKESQLLLDSSTSLAKAYSDATGKRILIKALGYILWILCWSLVIYFIHKAYIHIQALIQEKEQENKINEQAIELLINDIENLADGDLTVHAKTNQGITRPVAESINFALDALRKLIVHINETTTDAGDAVIKTRDTGIRLSNASEAQANKIAGITESVNEMAQSFENVSATATKSTEVAEDSVSIASNGVNVVADMIMGMGQIRQQIQETSKQIKFLGERSQEIGDIVSLIDDISDQTNILSLNAAIQAAMAGDAGRGFAVVADEVQRLAERSGHATREIENIVKNIQHDTNKVVVSMEHTTAEVVQGTKLAEDAGVSLEQIESVSKKIAELIQAISNEADRQARNTNDMTNAMEAIKGISVENAKGSTDTVAAIDSLNKIITELRNSVAGFKLPDN